MPEDYFLTFVDNKLSVPSPNGESLSLAAQFIHTQLRTLALHPQFPFSHIQAEFQKGNYHFGIFNEIGSQETTQALKSSLDRWIKEDSHNQASKPIFVSCYKTPVFPINLDQFALLLKKMLQNIGAEYLEDANLDQISHLENINFKFCYHRIQLDVKSLFSGNSLFWMRFGWPSLIFSKIDLASKNQILIDCSCN